MVDLRNLAVKTLIAVLLLSFPIVSRADEIERRRQVSLLISDTADHICGIVQSGGLAKSANVKGQVNAQVGFLKGALAKIGVDAGASADETSSSWSGVLAQDARAALKDNQDCRQHVFDRMSDLLTSAQVASLRRADGTPGTRTTVKTVQAPINPWDLHADWSHIAIASNISLDNCASYLSNAASQNHLTIIGISSGHGIAYARDRDKVVISCESAGDIMILVLGSDVNLLSEEDHWAAQLVRTVMPEPQQSSEQSQGETGWHVVAPH